RRECLDHIPVLDERTSDVSWRSTSATSRGATAPGIGQRVPVSIAAAPPRRTNTTHGLSGVPGLGGLHHAYRLAASDEIERWRRINASGNRSRVMAMSD